MDEREHIEYLGLAAALGRLMASLKQTEELLDQVTRQRDELLAAKESDDK